MAMTVAGIAMLTMMILLVINAGRMSFLWLKLIFANINPVIFGWIYGIVAVVVAGLFILSRVPGIAVNRRIFSVDHYALGFFVYFLMIVNVVNLIIFCGKLVSIWQTPVPKAVMQLSGIVTVVVILGVFLYGAVNHRSLVVKRYQIKVEKQNESGEDLKIALVSDIHLGYVIEEQHLERIVEAVNAMDADLICLAGDIFDGDITSLSDWQKLSGLFRDMQSKYGVYACLGNHDAGAGYDQMIRFLEDSEIHILQDEAVVIDGRLVLIGRQDSQPIGRQGKARESVPVTAVMAELPVIVMDHQPGNIGEYTGSEDLILCGHTHKGQMFPFNLITNAIFDVDYGYYQASPLSPQVIVTSGAGTWGPPLRVGSNREVVEITIQFSE